MVMKVLIVLALLIPSLVFSATVEKKEEKKSEKVEQTRWTGERISVDFKDIDLRDFFLFIADFSGMNMILDPAVKGTLTIKLTDVPWDQALDLVCRQYGLAYEIDGKVYSVN
jgi:type IV pilus assembly protein PilQ